MSTATAAKPGVNPLTERMLRGPVVATLLRLATPNIIGLFATTLMIGYDGWILGKLGADALAGIALVLPIAMLMLQMSAGGIGGATTAAIARALGAGDRAAADGIARHALVVAAGGAAIFTFGELAFGHLLYTSLGGRAGALASAHAYAGVLFGGAISVWLANVLAGIVRGGGHMVLGSAGLLGTAAVHVVLSPLLVFGWGDWHGLGIAGAATSTVIANTASSLLLLGFLLRGRGDVQLLRGKIAWQPELLQRILRVGVPASANPLISNASIALTTGYVGTFGTVAVAGFGVAARLEYILVPIAFGFGSALTAMVATNLGAGQHVRAKQVTWAGARMVLAVTGAIGLAAAIWPAGWMDLFTTDAAVREAGAQYLRIVGLCYGLFGLGLALFFASQGAGRMAGPLLASSLRLVVVAIGGWVVLHALGAPAVALYAVVALSFVAYASTLGLAVAKADWSAQRQAPPAKSPAPVIAAGSTAARPAG